MQPMPHSKTLKTFSVIVVLISLSLFAQTVIGSFQVVSVASQKVREAVEASEYHVNDKTVEEADRLNRDLDWLKEQIAK